MSPKKRLPRAGTPISKKKMRGELSKAEKTQEKSSSIKEFQSSWLKQNAFKHWLAVVDNDTSRAKCKVCNKILLAGKSELEKHAKGKKHKTNMKAIQGVQPIDEACKEITEDEKAVKTAEVLLSMFFVEHNIAIANVDHLTEQLKIAIPDSKIVKNIQLDRTKTTAIIQNVVAKTVKEEIISTLKEVKFSVLIDESTDISNKKNMVVLAKYVCPKTGKVCTPLLDLVELDAANTTAEALWERFCRQLESHGIPWKDNLIGLACDHASVMVGSKNSFATRFKAACPWGVLLDCICHSAHIAASSACKKLPELVTKTIRRLASYISSSPKRCTILEGFQQLYLGETKKLLHLSTTRWLVMHSCVSRVLENLVPLQQYFRQVVAEDARDTEAKELLRDLRNPFFEAYLLFLKYSLQYFNEMNALYQSERTLIHKLSAASKVLLKKVCTNYIKDEHLTNVDSHVDVSSPRYMEPLEAVFLGPNVSEILQKIPLPDDPTGSRTQSEQENQRSQDIRTFRTKCLDFYVTAAVQLKKYLPMKSMLIKEAAFIEPGTAISVKRRQEENLTDIPNLSLNFKDCLKLDPQEVAKEWRSMPVELPSHKREAYEKMTPEEFWFEVSKMKTFEDSYMYPNLSKLAFAVISFPHSNAEAERVFSAMTDIKTKKRNKMGNVTLDALLVSRTHLRQSEKTCSTFNVNEAHFRKINKTMYPQFSDIINLT